VKPEASSDAVAFHAAAESARQMASPPLHETLRVVPQAAAMLVAADRAALLIEHGGRYVLVSSFGAVPFPTGLRSRELPEALAGSAGASGFQVVHHGGQRLGMIWVGRPRGQFAPDALRPLERLGDLVARALHRPVQGDEPQDEPPGPAASATSPPAPPDGDSRTLRLDGGELIVPAFPPMLSRIVTLAENENTTPAELLTAVSADPVLVAQAMKVASSPAFARARPPRTVKEALLVLGLRGVRNLAVGQFTRSLFARWDTVDQLLWEHGLGTAVGMQLLLETQDPSAAEDGYLCGLLHNLGTIVLHNTHPERYQRVIARVVIGPDAWPDVEQELFGVRSITLLPRLLDGWHLPERVVRLLRDLAHGHRGDELADAFAWACPTGLAASPAWRHALGERSYPDWLVRDTEAGRAAAGLSDERAAMLSEVVASRCETLRRLIA
jgi:HD-like signal output (HDOD) protein